MAWKRGGVAVSLALAGCEPGSEEAPALDGETWTQGETWTTEGCEFDDEGMEFWSPEQDPKPHVRLTGCPIRITAEQMPDEDILMSPGEGAVVCQTNLEIADVLERDLLDDLGFYARGSYGTPANFPTRRCVDLDSGETLHVGWSAYSYFVDSYSEGSGVAAYGDWIFGEDWQPQTVLVESMIGFAVCGSSEIHISFVYIGRPYFAPQARRIQCHEQDPQ